MRFMGLLIGAIGACFMMGCSDGTGPAGTGRLTLQLVGRTSATAAPTYSAAADVLVISSVQVVARKIRLERAEGTCAADQAAASPGQNSRDSEGDEHAGDCAQVWLDPMLLAPPVDAAAKAILSVDLPEGRYQELKIQVHKPTDAAADATFLSANPAFQNVSVKVTGTFNGAAFTFTSALTAEVEIELEKAVEVSAATPAAMTLQVDLASWFAGEAGALLSPIEPGQQVRSQIEQNIRRSFHAFEDHDRDGHPD